jgi:hypothetical protein
MISPQQRSLNHLRKLGYLVQTVESWQRFPAKNQPCRCCGQQKMASVRRDLFGFGDLFAISKTSVLLIQVTSGSNAASRVSKMLNDKQVAPNVLRCLQAGIGVVVHSWALQGPRGERKTWTLRVQEIKPEQIAVPAQAQMVAEDYPLFRGTDD